ncbi:MAG: hypothetical protein WCV73_04165 [Patescibacteria group bacterium]|jgi:hypothetical protein
MAKQSVRWSTEFWPILLNGIGQLYSSKGSTEFTLTSPHFDKHLDSLEYEWGSNKVKEWLEALPLGVTLKSYEYSRCARAFIFHLQIRGSLRNRVLRPSLEKGLSGLVKKELALELLIKHPMDFLKDPGIPANTCEIFCITDQHLSIPFCTSGPYANPEAKEAIQEANCFLKASQEIKVIRTLQDSASFFFQWESETPQSIRKSVENRVQGYFSCCTKRMTSNYVSLYNPDDPYWLERINEVS